MTAKEVLKKNRNFIIGVILTVLEGMLSGSIFMLLYCFSTFSQKYKVRLRSIQMDMELLPFMVAFLYKLRRFPCKAAKNLLK